MHISRIHDDEPPTQRREVIPTLQIFDTVMVTGFYCVHVSALFSFTYYREFPYGNSL